MDAAGRREGPETASPQPVLGLSPLLRGSLRRFSKEEEPSVVADGG